MSKFDNQLSEGHPEILNQPPKPIAPISRLVSLDVLRGCAVLGILIMNIQLFSMIEAAYFNPAAFGDLSGANKWVWTISHIFADQKFMTIFSILFGAGIVLITQKIEIKRKSPFGLYYRRIFWLLLIGLVHAYIFWYGDILVTYALCGSCAYLFRRMYPKKLFIMGITFLSVSSMLFFMFGYLIPNWEGAVEFNMAMWKPNDKMILKEVSAYQGGWISQMSMRVQQAFGVHTFAFLAWGSWRAGGLMLIGMAFYKWGILTAELSRKTYIKFTLIGFGIGLPIIVYGVICNFTNNWSMVYSQFLGSQFNYWGSLLLALGYIGIVMLFCKNMFFQKLKNALAAVGRMALTNYLLQTLICTSLFYGHGLGLFGKLERFEQILIVFAVWLFQLILSPIWLHYFRFGPAEWLWRSLTYLKIQPMQTRTPI